MVLVYIRIKKYYNTPNKQPKPGGYNGIKVEEIKKIKCKQIKWFVFYALARRKGWFKKEIK